jgi:catechol 2,3-dioxygenase-like lactoylglutathione lyase family enzyme
MRLRSIAPHFVVPDVVRAAEHYRDKLGFEIVGYFAKPPVFATVRRDGLVIHLGKSSDGKSAPGSAHRQEAVDAYIWLDDVDALYAELKQRGADIVEGPVQRIYGCREIVVRDPDGFKIAFGQ